MLSVSEWLPPTFFLPSRILDTHFRPDSGQMPRICPKHSSNSFESNNPATPPSAAGAERARIGRN